MGIKEERQDDIAETSMTATHSEQEQLDNASRRRFTQTGLGVSGVILTLASRPVLGDVVCKSPSGFLSGNASTHGPQPVCMGRSPGYWKNHGNWPISPDARFSSIFYCVPNSPYKTVTMKEILSKKSYDQHNLGMHLAAAYLNAVSGWTPFLKVETIKAMFAEWQSKGYFSPTATVQWNAAQIVSYLNATQG